MAVLFRLDTSTFFSILITAAPGCHRYGSFFSIIKSKIVAGQGLE